MADDLTDRLCTQCGLCCDGTLFADVELSRGTEATRIEILGLDVEDDGDGGSVLQQPCRALRGTSCSIYSERPKCCRTFECGLLRDVREGRHTIEQAEEAISGTLRQIKRVTDLLGPAEPPQDMLPLKERYADCSSPSKALTRAMDLVTATIARVFLHAAP